MYISQYKHYPGFILGEFCCFVWVFFFLVQGEHSVYLELDYFILFRCQRSTSVFLGETEEHKNGSARPDQGSVQPRILLLPAASSRCSEQSTEKTGPVPRAPSRCPCCAPSTQWSQGFLSWSCSWTAVFDSPQWPGPLRICLIFFWAHLPSWSLQLLPQARGSYTACEVNTCMPSF